MSLTFASSNEGGWGSGAHVNLLRSCGAGCGVRNPDGSSGSPNGERLKCGARNAVQRKNGRGPRDACVISAAAFLASTSVE